MRNVIMPVTLMVTMSVKDDELDRTKAHVNK